MKNKIKPYMQKRMQEDRLITILDLDCLYALVVQINWKARTLGDWTDFNQALFNDFLTRYKAHIPKCQELAEILKKEDITLKEFLQIYDEPLVDATVKSIKDVIAANNAKLLHLRFKRENGK